MSYPQNLGARINYLTNYNTNSVKLNPDNSVSELSAITSGSKVQFTLPPNSLVDLSSFSVFALFNCQSAADNAQAIRPHYLTRYANAMIKRLTVEIGGNVINDIEDYNLINQIFSDYQFGVEGSSKKLLSNIDPFQRAYQSGSAAGGVIPLDKGVAGVDLIENDTKPICLNQFLGFMGGGAGVKYIDTQLTGQIKITIELAPANNILFRGVDCQLDGTQGTLAGITDADCVTQAVYSLNNIHATIKKISIDDGVYFASISQALSSGIPFEYKYNHFYQTKSNATNGDLTMRYEVMSNSVDMALLTFQENEYKNAVKDLPDADNLLGYGRDLYDNYPYLNAKSLANMGKKNCFCSGYFKRTGPVSSAKFYINGESLPQYEMTAASGSIYQQSLIDFGIHDDTANGIYYGINSYESWIENYFVATARLSHVTNDDSFISGFNANGIPLTISVETKSLTGGSSDYTGQLWVMTTEVLQVYAGRQINRIK